LRRGSRPRTGRHTEAHWNVRVFALRHGCIAEIAPNEHSKEHYPGDVRMFDEEPRDIASAAGVLLVFECHLFIPLWDNLDEIAVFQTSGSNDDDFFAWIYTVDCHIALVGFAQLDVTQMRDPLAGLFSGHENRVLAG